MKRSGIFFLYAVCFLCLLAACGREAPTEVTDWTEAQMAQAIWDSQGGTEAAQALLSGEEDFSTYLSEYYHLAPGDVQGGAVLYAGGVSALEVAVLRMAGADDTGGAEEALRAYIDSRAGAFAGYAPEQYDIVENSGTASRGQYIALLICPDQQAAQDAFDACFTAAPPAEAPSDRSDTPPGVPEPEDASPPPSEAEDVPQSTPADEPEDAPEGPPAQPPESVPDAPDDPQENTSPPEPEEEPQPEPEPDPVPSLPEGPWSYDRARIVSAWSTGNREGLWEQDLAILAVLDEIPALTDEALTDYGRELALHDWMIGWAEYDPGALSSGPRGDPMPDNDNPYGFLTGQKGICLGYAATFQLLMDLSGIECITVNGMSHGNTAEHAWNLVKLDGDWYAVDATWDDPVASFPVPDFMSHRYFNVTSEFLRANDHQWDDSAVPEAEGTALAWAS